MIEQLENENEKQNKTLLPSGKNELTDKIKEINKAEKNQEPLEFDEKLNAIQPKMVKKEVDFSFICPSGVTQQLDDILSLLELQSNGVVQDEASSELKV